MADKNEDRKVQKITHSQYGGALTSDFRVSHGLMIEPQSAGGWRTALSSLSGQTPEVGAIPVGRDYVVVKRWRLGEALAGEPAHTGTEIEETTMPAADSPSREEVNAKLEAVEARLDSKLAGIAADIKIIVSGQASMREDIRDVRRDIGSYKTAVIVTGVAIVAMMLGFLAFGVQILELASGLFEAGVSK